MRILNIIVAALSAMALVLADEADRPREPPRNGSEVNSSEGLMNDSPHDDNDLMVGYLNGTDGTKDPRDCPPPHCSSIENSTDGSLRNDTMGLGCGRPRRNDDADSKSELPQSNDSKDDSEEDSEEDQSNDLEEDSEEDQSNDSEEDSEEDELSGPTDKLSEDYQRRVQTGNDSKEDQPRGPTDNALQEDQPRVPPRHGSGEDQPRGPTDKRIKEGQPRVQVLNESGEVQPIGPISNDSEEDPEEDQSNDSEEDSGRDQPYGSRGDGSEGSMDDLDVGSMGPHDCPPPPRNDSGGYSTDDNLGEDLKGLPCDRPSGNATVHGGDQANPPATPNQN